jgi:hypothetical protein
LNETTDSAPPWVNRGQRLRDYIADQVGPAPQRADYYDWTSWNLASMDHVHRAALARHRFDRAERESDPNYRPPNPSRKHR